MAASAGLRVSELIAEITVETAIVTANWRKNWPVIPLMNAHGTNTAQSTSATAITGPVTSSIALRVRLRGGSPCSEPALDVLDDHDRVVDHDPDRQHQAEQRDVVQAESQRGHDGEGADDRDRHGHQRDERRPPVLEEHEHHHRNQDRRPRARSCTTSTTDSRMNGVVS